MGVSLANDTIRSGGRDRIKLEDLFDLIKFPNHELKTLRPVGEISALGTHWFEVITKEGKKIRVGKTCRNVMLDGSINPKGFDGKGGCAFCKVSHNPRTSYFQNMIDVEEEENAPGKPKPPTPEEKKSGFKAKGSKLWTPCGVLPFPPSAAQTMQLITKKNKDKDNKVRELSDRVFGRALDISKDTRDGVAPANMWNVQKSDEPMRKLTQEQRGYYLYDLSLLAKMYPTAKESKADLEYNIVGMIEADYEKLDMTDFPDLVAKRDKKGKKSKGGKFRTEDEDDEDEDDLPKKKSKSSRRVDDDDDDEDDMPKRKKSTKSRRRDDDEDEDEAPKKKKKKGGKSYTLDDFM